MAMNNSIAPKEMEPVRIPAAAGLLPYGLSLASLLERGVPRGGKS